MKRLWTLWSAALLAGGAVYGQSGEIVATGGEPPTTLPAPITAHRIPAPPINSGRGCVNCPPGSPLVPFPVPPISPTPSTSPSSTPQTPSPTDPGAGTGGGGGESGSGGLTSAAPNMVGDLLYGGRNVSFIINRERGPTFIEATGATNLTNPKVADDNSPLPRDRVGFRFNYFRNAQSITGLADQTIFAPDRSLNGFIRPTQTKDYDYNLYTFNWEQTFLDGLASWEVRVPIRTGLASNNSYSVGTIQGKGRYVDATGVPLYYTRNPAPGMAPLQGFPLVNNVALADQRAAALGLTPLYALNVNPTPSQTLGRTDTELDNVSVILKALLYQNRTFSFSGGLSVTAPTARDTRFTVTDYLGLPIPSPPIGTLTFNNVDTMRVREFVTTRDTWGVSPFVAALCASPDSRFFGQGFLQLDLPVGSDRVRYTEATPVALNPIVPVAPLANDPRGNVVLPPFSATGSVRDQTLLHMDLGGGYWLLRDQNRPFLNGLAATMELHYTTTLNTAHIVNLPNDPSTIGTPSRAQVANGGGAIAPGATNVFTGSPTVGNLRNRMDIVNLTLGTTFVLGNQATLATAVALPLRGGDNRTFDWELQMQFNWYFGARGGGSSVPTMR